MKKFSHLKPRFWVSTLVLCILAGPAGPLTAGKIIRETGVRYGYGGFNMDNVEIVINEDLESLVNEAGSSFDELTGQYEFSEDSAHVYAGHVYDATEGGTEMGLVLAKDWPVGEPPGIKVVNDDYLVKYPKPQNCIMSTSFLEGHFLDDYQPLPVNCSGPYQSHKRFKIPMLPTTVDGGVDSVDLVFNVEEDPDGPTRDYQVFQKINNWTDQRLAGFTLEVGFGVGSEFQSVEDAGVSFENLNISVPSEIWNANQLAHFSTGLFVPEDQHTGEVGYFDPEKLDKLCLDNIARFKRPKTYIQIDELPKNNYGKILKTELRALLF